MDTNKIVNDIATKYGLPIIGILLGIIIILVILMYVFKKKNNLNTLLLFLCTILTFLLSLVGCIKVLNNTNYGLDLKGGFEVLYQVHSLEGGEVTNEMVLSTYRTILKRIDVLGVSEPEITIEGNDRIRIRLAGITDSETARNILSTTASLTFRDTSDKLLMTSSVLKGSVKLSNDNYGKPAVLLPIGDTNTFYNVTNEIKDREDNRIVIWLDFDSNTDSYYNEKDKCGSLSTSRCLSAATVSQAFASDVIIQGNFTLSEAKSLVDLINSGALPTSLEELSSRLIEASFGENSLNKTLTAGLIGIILVIITMIITYNFAGIISSVSVMLYTTLSFLIFNLIGGVLILPGIAAMLLGIGMAVDVSVISYERVKEELKQNKSLDKAFKDANKMSISSIIDANVTTFIVALILFIFGESSIKGFATMLIINIIFTILIMVYLNRFILGIFVKKGWFNNKLKLFVRYDEKEKKINEIFKKTNYVKIRKYVLSITAFLIIIGLSISLYKGFNFGVDFLGGSNITISNNESINEEDVINDIKYTIEKTETNNEMISILIKEVLNKEQAEELKNTLKDKYNVDTDIFVVSSLVKQELTKNCIYSLLIAFICIIIYVSIRFKFNYAISALIPLIHDVSVVIIIFGLFNIEITTIFIAAILTIIGYSINNTIVTFDRIRENYKTNKGKMTDNKLEDIVNLSVNQTLFRSFLTTLTTILPVISLIILGSREILNFNIALLIGFIAGMYSSIFISNTIWYILESKLIKRGPKKKKWNFDEPEELKVKGINS